MKRFIITFLFLILHSSILHAQPYIYPDEPKFSNYTATTSPTVNDDEGDGYEVGSVWFDINSDTGYVCLDSTLGAAIWKITTDTYSSSSPLTTKGDILTYSITDVRLGVGSNNQLLTADSAQSTGIKWAWEVKDEDNMASDSNTSLATQQSIKSYVDTSVYPPGGSNTHVQYNDSGVFSGNSGLVYNDSTYALTGGGNWEISKATPEIKLTDTGDSNSARITRTDTSAVTQFFATVGTPATANKALSFDGAGTEYMIAPYDSTMDFPGDFTILMWVNYTSIKTGGLILKNSLMSKGDYVGSPTYWYFNTTGADGKTLTFAINSVVIASQAITINTGTWYQVGVRRSGTTIELIYNGATIGSSGSSSNSLTSLYDIYIGRHEIFYGSGRDFDGKMDEIVIWKRALSDNDIADSYNSGVGLYHDKTQSFPTDGTSINTNLSSLWHLDETSGSSASDSSDNGNTITLYNMEDEDWVDGFINSVAVDNERSVFKMEDGYRLNEGGILTIGDADIRLILEAGDIADVGIRFNLNSTEVAKFDGSTKTFIVNNGVTGSQQAIFRAAASASENIQEWQDSSENILAYVDENGDSQFGHLTIGTAETGVDYTLTFDGETNDIVVTWKEDENNLDFDKPVSIGGGEMSHDINGTSRDSQLEIHSEGESNPAGLTIHRHGDTNPVSSAITMMRSKGTHASQTIVNDGSDLGRIISTGYDGTDEALATELRFEVDGTPGNDDMPGRIVFLTSADGAQTPLESFRIKQDQNILVATDNEIQLRDTAITISSATDGHMDFAADVSVDFNTPVLDLSNQTVDVTLNNAVDSVNFDSNTLSIDASNNRIGIGDADPDTKLEVNGAITIQELSSDPADPAEGKAVFWMGDGTGSGADGDLLYMEQSGATVATGNLKWTDFAPSSITVNASDGTTGNVSDTQTMFDGNVLQIEELAATPGFDVEFEFSNIDKYPTMVVTRWLYSGSDTHDVTWGIWNYNTTAWDTLRVFQDSGGYESSMTMYIPRNSNGNYVSLNNAKIRVYHHSAGSAAHYIQIDYVGLTHSLQGVI